MKAKRCLPLKTKSEIIQKLDKGFTLKSLAYQYGVTKSTISRIKNGKRKILKASTACSIKRKSLKKGEFANMETKLYKWFITQRSRYIPISGNLFKEKAKELHAKIYGNGSGFNASSGWLNGFKARFGIRLLKICGEKLSSNQEAVPAFKAKFWRLKNDLQLDENQVYNADETGLFWKLLPDKTYVSSNEKNACGRKSEKARVTVLVCTNATGKHKLKPLVIGQAKKPRSFRNFQLPLNYRWSKRAWMTADIFEEWFHNSFVPEVN